jgi:hypothetical protein
MLCLPFTQSHVRHLVLSIINTLTTNSYHPYFSIQSTPINPNFLFWFNDLFFHSANPLKEGQKKIHNPPLILASRCGCLISTLVATQVKLYLTYKSVGPFFNIGQLGLYTIKFPSKNPWEGKNNFPPFPSLPQIGKEISFFPMFLFLPSPFGFFQGMKMTKINHPLVIATPSIFINYYYYLIFFPCTFNVPYYMVSSMVR